MDSFTLFMFTCQKMSFPIQHKVKYFIIPKPFSNSLNFVSQFAMHD